MNKIRNIEFLRIVGCLSIILFHLFGKFKFDNGIYNDISMYSYLQNITQNGRLAVELFFILSGVFFAITYKSTISITDFVKKKITRLSPVLIFSIFIAFVFSIFKFVRFKFYNNLLGVLFLSGTPFVLSHDNTTNDWYIGAMFWTLLLLFYLKQNFQQKNINIILSIGIFLSYSIVIHFNDGKIDGTVYNPYFYNILNFGILRAFGGIGLGYFIGEFYKNNIECIKNIVISQNTKVVLSIIEILCVGFIIKNLMLYNLHFDNQIIFVVIFALTIILFLFNKGYLSEYLSKDILVKLSKYTYSLFLTHHVIIHGIKGSLWKYCPSFVYNYPLLNIILTLTIIFITGIFTYHFVEKPSGVYLKKKFKI